MTMFVSACQIMLKQEESFPSVLSKIVGCHAAPRGGASSLP